MKIKLSLLVFLVIVFLRVSSQVTFTHTLNADFNKGITENVLVKNDGLSLPFKKSVINDWTSTTNLPQNLAGQQVTTWRSFVFLSGGFNGTKYNNFVYRAAVNAAGISSWTQVSSLPDSVGYHAMIATGTKLYVIGGKKGALPSSKIYVATINDDGSLGTWSQIAIMLPQPLWGHTAQLVNGFLYVAGGTNVEGTFTALNAVYYAKIDAEDNLAAFTATTALPEARNGHSMTRYNGKLYVLGGYDNAGVRKTTVYYSTVNANGTCGSWLSATPLPVAVSNHISTCSNGIITVIGGEENTILSNKFYLADIDNAPSLAWELSDRYLFDRAKNSSAFAADNQIVYTGGVISTGVPVNTMRYVSIVSSVNRVKKGIFISTPFVVGAPKNIQKLTYTLPIQSGDTYELLYRLAGADKVWGDWVSAGTGNPSTINQTKSYIQYMFRLNANSTNDIVLNDITLTVSGYTQLCGNLDAMTTLASSGSPYWATCDITFTTGSHIIQPGVTIVFSPNTGLTIGQASVSFNGSAAQPVRLASYDSTDGTWNGVYFTDASDAGVSSQMNYTTIERAGNATNNANLWCSNTNQPVVNNCTFRKAVGYGVRMENSNFILNNTIISDNAESGLYLYQSNPILNNVATQNNGYAGIYYASVNLNPSYSYTKSQNNLYGLYSPTPDVSFIPESATTLLFLNNTTDIAVAGGVIYANRAWKYFANGYVLLGDVTVNQGGGNPTLTIGPGTRIKVMPNYGLYIGGASTTGGQLYAVGKADSLITFTAANGVAGGWKGLYFNDGSDYNSTSSLRYCTVELGNEYNIFSVNSNEPHIMFSTIRNSVTYGVKLQNSNINIEETTVKKAQQGIYLDNSSPSLILVTIDSIQFNCVYHASALTVPTYSQCMMKNSLYGINYPNPNFSVPTYSNITFSNLTASVAMNGGDISSDQTWNYNPYGYAILDNVRVLKGVNGPKARLTIRPGCTLKFAAAKQLQIGYVDSYWYVGELNAVATAASPITFTALNGLTGGWNGIYFNNASDEYTGMSVMRNCIVEKGNSYNIWSNSTSQPTIDSCTIKYSLIYGLNLESSPLAISNSNISNNGGIGINSVNSLLTISKTNILNNGGYGLYYNNAYYVNNLQKLQIYGNSQDGVFSAGGDISDDRTWYCFGNKPYVFLDNVRVIKGNNGPKARLTVKPGCVVKFAVDKQLQIGYVYSYWYVGELWAAGTSDSLITFTSYNDAVGGWNGIYFHDASDLYSATSMMKNCVVEKGNQFNIWCNNTTQPTIDSCTIRYSLNMGLNLETAPLSITNTSVINNGGIGISSNNSLLTLFKMNFLNNGGYGLYYNSANYVGSLKNLQFTGNNTDGVFVNGGDISDDRTWYCFGNKPYVFTDNVRVMKGNNGPKARLTIKPGCTLKFAADKQLQIGYVYSYWYVGELYAIGTPDSLINFTSFNDAIGGWNGIYFHDASDMYSAISLMKYCTVTKGNQYNIWCNNTVQPTLERVTLSQSAGYGLWLDAANVTVKNSIIKENQGYGVYLTSASNPAIGNNFINACDIYSNNYNIFNNTSNNIDMRYNFLGSCDSSYIEKKTWDKTDNTSLGKITFMPFSWLPTAQPAAINVSGKFLYDNNASKPLRNAVLTLKDYTNNTLATATTNTTGAFTFAPLQLSIPTKIDFTLQDQFGGINSTDALKVMQHFTFISLLDANHSFIADVNKSRTVNGTDALMILQRFTGIISSFPAGNLQIDCDSVTPTPPAFYYNLAGTWFGDVNGSYSTLSKTPGLSLVYNGTVNPGSRQEFGMRVKVLNKLDAGAISLVFNYPTEYLEVLGVQLAATAENLAFTAQDRVLKTGWYNLNPVATQEGDVLVTIRFRTRDLGSLAAPVSITLGEGGEIADPYADPYGGVILSVPVIPATLTTVNPIDSQAGEPSFSFYPNPVKDRVTFIVNLAGPGMVSLCLTDITGRVVARVTEEEFGPGEHRKSLDLSSLVHGIYFCRFRCIAGGKVTEMTLKLVID
ncbi:MAG: right-handed parallel beta-helix repeat-containing protein [Bacteroidetes bacterium]|nr:right-handed parallel beta-helix repeat-containing protein [Bacteroidota bacterium]